MSKKTELENEIKLLSAERLEVVKQINLLIEKRNSYDKQINTLLDAIEKLEKPKSIPLKLQLKRVQKRISNLGKYQTEKYKQLKEKEQQIIKEMSL